MKLQERPFPDFIIAGAAKAGTTSLAVYLAQHPAIYMSPVKEPHYFSKDIDQDAFRPLLKQRLKHQNLQQVFDSKGNTKLHRAYITDSKIYSRLFEFANPNQLLAEASPSYLYSEVAASEIHKHNPQAKIILLLREPVSRAFSHYQMDVRIGFTKGSFEEALASDELHAGRSWGSRSHYKELGLYENQVKRFLNVFPKDQILIILYDELKENTPLVLKKIFRFLNIEDHSSGIDLTASNRALEPRTNIDLQSPLAEKIKQTLRKLPAEQKIRKILKKLFYREPEIKTPLPETIQQLKHYFHQDIVNLEVLTGINLEAWKK